MFSHLICSHQHKIKKYLETSPVECPNQWAAQAFRASPRIQQEPEEEPEVKEETDHRLLFSRQDQRPQITEIAQILEKWSSGYSVIPESEEE